MYHTQKSVQKNNQTNFKVKRPLWEQRNRFGARITIMWEEQLVDPLIHQINSQFMWLNTKTTTGHLFLDCPTMKITHIFSLFEICLWILLLILSSGNNISAVAPWTTLSKDFIIVSYRLLKGKPPHPYLEPQSNQSKIQTSPEDAIILM